MTRRRIIKTLILSVLPPAVLCLLYGLWLLSSAPSSPAAVLYALFLLVLFIAVYVYAVWDAENRICRTDLHEEPVLSRVRKIDGREMGRIFFVLVCFRLLIFVLAYVWELLVNGYSGTVFEMQHIWADHPLAARYISMANRGYSWETGGTGVHANLSVAPLFGLLIRFTSPSANSSIRIAFFLANLNAVLAGATIYALTVRELDRRRARFAAAFFCLLPSSFLMSCTLGDSTFLLLSLLTCYAARQRVFFAAAGLGALASLAAPQGAALLLPALLEYDVYFRERLHGDKEERNLPLWIGEGASLLLIPAGLFLYLYKNRSVTGNAFYFIELTGGYRFFFEQGAALVQSALSASRETFLSELLPAALALPAAFAAFLLTKKRFSAPARLYFLLFVLLVPNAAGAWPRLLFTCFPVIMAAAELASRKKWIAVLLIVGCSALLLLRLGMYALGWGGA